MTDARGTKAANKKVALAVDLDELETLASVATPGPWTYDGVNYVWDDDHTMVVDHHLNEPGQVSRIRGFGAETSANATRRRGQMDRNAEYIAAMHPRTALGLIGEVRRLQVALDEAKAAGSRDVPTHAKRSGVLVLGETGNHVGVLLAAHRNGVLPQAYPELADEQVAAIEELWSDVAAIVTAHGGAVVAAEQTRDSKETMPTPASEHETGSRNA